MLKNSLFDPSLPTTPTIPYSYEAVRENRRELAYEILSNPWVLKKPLFKELSNLHKQALWKQRSIWLYAPWVRAKIRKIEKNTWFITQAERVDLYDELKFLDAMIAFWSDEQARQEILRGINKFQAAINERNISLQ
jgi:hypothetical protein